MESHLITEQMVPSGQLTRLNFDLMTGKEIEKYCYVSVVETSDLNNAKLGLPNALSECATCGSGDIRDCEGHFGVVKLPATIYHPLLFSEVLQILNRICPGCKSIKPERQIKGSFTLDFSDKTMQEGGDDFELCYRSLNGIGRTNFRRKLKKILQSKFSFLTRSDLSRFLKVRLNNFKKCSNLKSSTVLKARTAATESQAGCKYCSRNSTEWYPTMKFRIMPEDNQGKKSFSIIAEINGKLPKKFQNRCISEFLPKEFWNIVPNDLQEQGSKRIRITLSPPQVYYLLREVDPDYIKKFVSRLDLLFLSYLPVTPNCHRVMETYNESAGGPRLCFDERTKAFKRVVDLSRKIDELQQHQLDRARICSCVTSHVLDCLSMSKLHTNHSSTIGSPTYKSGMKWFKEVALSKRTDHSFRMVVIGDPYIRLGEIGIPWNICENLFIAEHVNSYNLKKLSFSYHSQLLTKELYTRSKGRIIPLHKTGQLEVGDTFYRPLEDGDILLVNRPPSKHQHSLIALYVKVLPFQSVIAINPLSCAPLAGDFDGDCLHGYVPQSMHSRVELRELVSLESQYLNTQDGQSLVSLTNDSLTAAHLLIHDDVFLNKCEMQQLEMLCSYRLPFPAIVRSPKSDPLWTGQQLLTMLLCPSWDFVVESETDQKCKEELPRDSSLWVKKTIPNLISRMFRHFGKRALNFLFTAQEVLCEWISLRGFTVSLSDIYLSPDYSSHKKMIDEVNYALQDAEYACFVKELIMDTEIEFVQKSHDENEELSYCLSNDNPTEKPTCLSHVSVAAFKDVFRDLQNALCRYISKENSILTMLHAGSQGNLMKLVQQGACLGLQLSTGSLSFLMHHKLSGDLSNTRNACNSHGLRENFAESVRRQNYAVIRASFLDGLNPIECFNHALSVRPFMFKENVEIPGTLTRKLMFFMRDLYIAYDGTVRSAYGQQLVQFFYDMPEDTSSKNKESCEVCVDEDIKGNGLGGQPVGSWAASSISEAAYGASDLPINSLEASPLMNLKKIFECGRRKTSVDPSVSLILSKKLGRWCYGFEYGALEVKNHLDRVLFSDLITNFMIFYAGHEDKGMNFSPWISHFHVDKERLTRRRLTIQAVIEKLARNYDFMRKKMGKTLPKAHIRSQNCSFLNEEKEHDRTFCITVAVEISEMVIMLESIREIVIPALLQTLIKGFLEFKKVDILWESQIESSGELFVRVTMSENCPLGEFWSIITDACIPIMDLIDWERSHPDDIHDTFSAFGIAVAWKYFLRALKSTTSDIGRTIRQEHLLMVADCLSVTGQFLGLSTKGLKMQRKSASASSPFNQACFSNPRDCFINAAKQGSVDYLDGTVDALAWGKEAPLGTGGPFQIMYSGKVDDPKRSESIYEMLHHLKPDQCYQDQVEGNKSAYQNINDEWKGQSNFANADIWTGCSDDNFIFDGVRLGGLGHKRCVDNQAVQANGHFGFHASNKPKRQTSSGSKLKSTLGNISSWLDIVDMSSSLRTILNEYEMGESLDEADKALLMEALKYHPKKDAKIGTGVQNIKIGHNLLHPESRCFVLVREDGTVDDMSYHKCIIGAAKRISPEVGMWAEKRLYRIFWGS